MINPIDHQLSYWKVEKNAESHKDPASGARQALEAQASEKEAEKRDSSVQAGEDSRESQRSGVGDRDARRHKHKSEAREPSDTEEPTEETKREGLDFYA
nr:hypothetical protein [uncultured Dethiosulfovibrio sp.]